VHGTAVAIIKDAQGEITGIVSDKVSYEVPAEKRETASWRGNLTMTSAGFKLQPGALDD